MRQKIRILSLVLVLVLCAGVMAACGSSDQEDAGESSSVSDTETVTAGEEGTDQEEQEEADAASFTVAEVTAIAGDGTLTLTLCEPADPDSAGSNELTSYASLDLSQFQLSEETETYTVQDGTTVDEADNGTFTPASAEDIAVGDTLVIYTDADGQDAIVIYPQQAMTAA